MNRLLLTAAFIASGTISMAQVRLPRLFGDSMVLQRDRTIPVWGWAGKNEKIRVHFHQQTKEVTAGADGRWQTQLSPEAAGGPYDLTVTTGKQTTTLHGILTGDVWICSGQSNMNFRVKAGANHNQEIAQANYPDIRHFQVQRNVAGTPAADLLDEGQWKTATPANVGDFTAVGYFFGRELYQQLKVPIGLIHTSWGGTQIEDWISRESLAANPSFATVMDGLPVLDIDSAMAATQQALFTSIKPVQNRLPEKGETQEWKAYLFDDHTWPQMELPSIWEKQQLKNIDGIVWFRKTITVDAADAGKPAELKLARIDETDETYVNGVLVGNQSNAVARRIYTIPAGVLHAGKNVIAVRVTDAAGNGGIYGDAAEMAFTINNATQSLAGPWAFQVEAITTSRATFNANSYPCLLYNAMIHPLLPFAIKGAIWYQGESNAGRAYQYREAFPLMINDWRKQWKQGNFPFYFVQLASFQASGGNSTKGSSWAELREAQTLTLSLPNTGMAVTTDLGETKDIHPKNKQDVGKRLAAVALHDTYKKNNVYSGPMYKTIKIEGNKAIISFTQTGSGLITKDASGEVKTVEIAGADQQFYPAQTTISNGQLVASSDKVSQPVAVRFAWSDDPGEANLYNKEGFPACPFRTDQWKASTAAQRYKVR